MSIDEMRFQDAHEFEQVQPNYYEQQYYDQNQYNPYQNHGFINEGQQPIQPVQINNEILYIKIYIYQNGSELNENFRSTAPTTRIHKNSIQRVHIQMPTRYRINK